MKITVKRSRAMTRMSGHAELPQLHNLLEPGDYLISSKKQLGPAFLHLTKAPQFDRSIDDDASDSFGFSCYILELPRRFAREQGWSTFANYEDWRTRIFLCRSALNKLFGFLPTSIYLYQQKEVK